MFYESVKFFNFIKKEKQFIDIFLEDNHIDMIVSDNRYGLYSDKVESVIITHQLYPKAPAGEKLLHQKIEKLLSNFNAIWIPDVVGEKNLSGDLSHLKPFNHPHKFIGPLSRFLSFELPPIKEGWGGVEEEFDICAIISGPEPQRTIFEKLIFEQIRKYHLKAVVVRGLPNCNSKNEKFVFNHLPTNKLQDYISKSRVVLCRSGYSSIMDLAVLKKQAILVPTPGQTEQEYLVGYNNKYHSYQNQNEFSLKNYRATLK